MMPTVAIIAGGHATRLQPITQTTPKAMVEIAGRPFIAHQLDLLKKNGIAHVVICSGYLSKQIEDFLGDGKDFGLSVKFSFDGEKMLGTGGAIKKALPMLTDPFFVMYGDSYLDIDFNQVYNHFTAKGKKGLMTVFKNQDAWDKSNLVFRDGQIMAYDKEEKIREMEYIDYGLGVLRKSALDEMEDKEVFDLAEIYKILVEQGQMLGYEVKTRFYEIGSPEGLVETEKYLLSLGKESR